jgi:hypothetical protein
MQKGKTGERYILGGENISYNKLFREINKIIGKKHVLFRTPLFLILGIANFLILLNKIFGIRPFITPAHVKKFSYNWETNTSKSEKELGYTKTGLNEALQKTITWINYSIKKL